MSETDSPFPEGILSPDRERVFMKTRHNVLELLTSGAINSPADLIFYATSTAAGCALHLAVAQLGHVHADTPELFTTQADHIDAFVITLQKYAAGLRLRAAKPATETAQ